MLLADYLGTFLQNDVGTLYFSWLGMDKEKVTTDYNEIH